ncbi:16S rRNA (cytidine(1402)-2'-O)-methyltransferase [Paenibacillus ehimensis]|uniref:Ribosomal RNA small subunit methyltransferase I n=1 Tax=Paenibacillus ehimensis TaxID=79264 RepID=A0ABT8VKP5_9BACL|nr:16S rRNA (cytidine(1402)-2'-O)-methyltransferase [Paenibacillus ehimensis]MDO3681516.1 16S rRNA (cytidine(1402)-2'-O)-methyltransferase [Paenibacillus ehimensis]MEC0213583.1 16S rRNA (cytidine(1402)-2'-O)-methyltransferase [Paenibacillus ehimensis]
MSVNVQKSYANDGRRQGSLYLVGTPIGNLEDMTYRAVRVLGEVQWIAAEDTRQTRKLLTHFDISTRLVSYHEHNKQASGPELIRLMQEGDSIALVSDAGLPAICDPGADLVRLAIEADIPVIPIPGANAALSGLIMSGLPTERFTFVGFLPRDKKPLERELAALKREPGTVICYESPHRLVKTLTAMAETIGEHREICLVRELTKKYEEAVRGTIRECLDHLDEHPPQGEYVLILRGISPEEAEASGEAVWWASLSPAEHVARYEADGLDHKEALRRAAQDRGVPKRELYNLLHQGS